MAGPAATRKATHSEGEEKGNSRRSRRHASSASCGSMAGNYLLMLLRSYNVHVVVVRATNSCCSSQHHLLIAAGRPGGSSAPPPSQGVLLLLLHAATTQQGRRRRAPCASCLLLGPPPRALASDRLCDYPLAAAACPGRARLRRLAAPRLASRRQPQRGREPAFALLRLFIRLLVPAMSGWTAPRRNTRISAE